MNLEDQLQQALRRAAAQDSDPGVRLGEVQGRARRVRARRRTSALAVAAAVVVVVGAPTALLVRDNGSSTPPPAHQGTPSPAPHPTPPTATPTGNATAAPHTLASFPQGASTFISWADGNGIVHSNGQRSQLPGTMARARATRSVSRATAPITGVALSSGT